MCNRLNIHGTSGVETMNSWLKDFRKFVGLILVAAAIGCVVRAKGETVDGYVTDVGSQTYFDIGGLHFVIDGNTRCAVEALTISFVGWDYDNDSSLQEIPSSKSRRAVPCMNEELKVGSRVKIRGIASAGARFLVTEVTVYHPQLRSEFTNVLPGHEWMGGALLEEHPRVTQTQHGWSGTLWLDGYQMAISSYTRLLTAPPGTELSYSSCGGAGFAHWCALMPKAPLPLFSASLFQPNTWITYRSVGPLHGKLISETRSKILVQHDDRSAAQLRNRVLVTQMRLWPNLIDEKQKRYLTRFTPLIQSPDYVQRIPGSVKFRCQPAEKTLKILPDREVQEFVSGVGQSLLPEYQKVLPEGDATKIDFRFYIAEGKRLLGHDQLNQRSGLLLLSQKDTGKGVTIFPNGLIVLPDYMLARMENEAQLAALLSDAIASVLQNQAFLVQSSNDTSSGLEANRWEAPLSLYLLMSEQAIRIGIRQMYLAGYDIREAPFAWAIAAGRPAMNPVTAPDRVSAKVPWHAAYAFDYIRQFYSGVDYSRLKRGEKEYALFLDELRRADPDAFAEKRGVQNSAAQIP